MIKKENSNNRQQNDSYNNFQIYRDSNGKIYLLKNGFDCTINNTCNNAERLVLAEKCFISQAAASMSLSQLENMLNTTLFDRVGKRMKLNAMVKVS